MAGRSRHGLHVVREGVPPAAPSPARRPQDGREQLFLSLHQQSVVLRIGGLLRVSEPSSVRRWST